MIPLSLANPSLRDYQGKTIQLNWSDHARQRFNQRICREEPPCAAQVAAFPRPNPFPGRHYLKIVCHQSAAQRLTLVGVLSQNEQGVTCDVVTVLPSAMDKVVLDLFP